VGYNGEMENYYLSDSGRVKRFSKAKGLNDLKINEALEVLKKHIFSKKQKDNRKYKKYAELKSKIIYDTDNKVEKAIIFDFNNNIVFEKLGTNKSVVFTKHEIKKMKGNSLIHNHPSGSTLSYQDIVLAIDGELKEIIAFSKKGTYYRLVIKNKLEIKEISLQYKRAFLKAKYVIKKLVENKILTIKQADVEFKSLTLSMFADFMNGVYYEETKYR